MSSFYSKLSINLFLILYSNICYRLTSRLTECKHLLLNQLGLFFKIGYVCTIPKGVEVGQDLTQLEAKLLCDESAGCDEVDDYFATEADIL